VAGIWGVMAWMLLILIVLAIGFADLFRIRWFSIRGIPSQRFRVRSRSFVTPEFEVPGRTAALELAIKTDLVDNWAYFNFALINSRNGTAYDFGREVSFLPATAMAMRQSGIPPC